jgi:SET domain-containing protein
MKDKLIQNNIEVRKSQKHGYGIFATDFIKKGTVIEECHYIKFKDHRYSIHEQFVMKGINEYKFDCATGIWFNL